MGVKVAVAGNAGPKIRSDCEITLEIRSRGGINISLASKVKTLYGDSISGLIREMALFFGIRNANVTINDSGALPFVISARFEAAIRQLTDTGPEFLPGYAYADHSAPSIDRRRFSRLYIPGNTPSMMINAGLHSADGIILDLEDSVAPAKKDEARILVRNALRRIDFRGAERMVRINQGDAGIKDLLAVVPQNVNMIIIPKCEDAGRVKEVEDVIDDISKERKLRNRVFLMPVIETALGIENTYEIACSSRNVAAIAIGLEDYTADLGVQRTPGGNESLYARMRLVNAAKAAGIQAIDSVFSDVGDMEGLKQNVLSSKALGFGGMGSVHPRQVPVINSGFLPGKEEIEKAKKIVLAFEEASRNNLGVIALGTKMIDKPVVERSRKLIKNAISAGLLTADWMDDASISEEKQ